MAAGPSFGQRNCLYRPLLCNSLGLGSHNTAEPSTEMCPVGCNVPGPPSPGAALNKEPQRTFLLQVTTGPGFEWTWMDWSNITGLGEAAAVPSKATKEAANVDSWWE